MTPHPVQYIPDSEPQPETPGGGHLFNLFVLLTLIAYISRIAELFPLLGKLRINLLLFAITLVLFLVTKAKKQIQIGKNRELILFTLFLLIGIATIPFSAWPSNTLKMCKEVLLLNFLAMIFFQASISTPETLYRASWSVIISCGLLVFGIYFRPVLVEGNRLSTTSTYDPNDLAMLFSATFPLVVAAFTSARLIGKIFFAPLAILLLAGVLATGSRGGMLALGTAILLIFFSKQISLKLLYKIVVIVTLTMILFSPRGENLRLRFVTLFQGKDYNIVNVNSHAGGRLAIWKSGMQLFITHPITGVGPGNSKIAMGLTYGNSSWKTMHNSYMQAALEMGLGGLVVYLMLLYRCWQNCALPDDFPVSDVDDEDDVDDSHEKLRILSAALRISLIAYMVAAFFLSQAFSIVLPVLLALSSGLHKLTTGDQNEDKASEPIAPQPGRKVTSR